MTSLSMSGLPASCATLYLLARFSFSKEECDTTYPCLVKVTSPSGKALSPDLTIDLKPQIHEGLSNSYTFSALFGYNGFTVTEAGVYKFVFTVGDLHLGIASIEAKIEKGSEAAV